MSAWKACDLRGPYPAEISPELFRAIGGRAAGLLVPGARVLVAGDFRLSTLDLKAALVEGLAGGGVQVVDAGQVPTPVAYFAHRAWDTAAVFVVTASHNPPDHNGLKLRLGALPPEEADFRRLREGEILRGRAGTVAAADPVPEYLAWLERRWGHLRRPFHVVLDAGNGACSVLGPCIFERLGFRVERLFCEIDGRFPNRTPDSARLDALTALTRRVQETGADLGIAWDGDGDRVTWVDERGGPLSADQMGVLLARFLLSRQPGQRVVGDLKLSDVFRRAVLEAGGVPLLERSGHAFIKRRMLAEDCLFGCEASGHYFFRELAGGDDGLWTALLGCELIAERGSLGRLRQEVPPMHISPDIRLRAAGLNLAAVAARLRERLQPVRELTLDGFRFEREDGLVLVRQSVTEPALTLRIEGFSEAGLERLRGLVAAACPEFRAQIALP